MKMLNIINVKYIQTLSVTLSYILIFISALESELLNSIFFHLCWVYILLNSVFYRSIYVLFNFA